MTDNISFERVEQLTYLEKTLTYKISIPDEIKKSACYLSVQNLLSSSLLSKNINIQIYRTIIFPDILYG
jgi:hypothetical protein